MTETNRSVYKLTIVEVVYENENSFFDKNYFFRPNRLNFFGVIFPINFIIKNFFLNKKFQYKDLEFVSYYETLLDLFMKLIVPTGTQTYNSQLVLVLVLVLKQLFNIIY